MVKEVKVRLPRGVKHGSLNAYDYYQCRCAQCRAEKARAIRDLRARKRAERSG